MIIAGIPTHDVPQFVLVYLLLSPLPLPLSLLSASFVRAIGIARATPFREPPVIRARGVLRVSLRTPSVLLNERRNIPSEIQTSISSGVASMRDYWFCFSHRSNPPRYSNERRS